MLPVAILAGGLGTRLRPLTDTIPKAMIEICGKPFVDWQLKLLSQHGIKKAVFCVAYRSQIIQEFVGDGGKYGIEVTYSEDGPDLLGTGGAIRKALPYLGQDFMVLYGDSYLPIDFGAVEVAYRAAQKPALMAVYRNDGALDKSNVLFSHEEIQKYSKSDAVGEMTHIDYGLSVFNVSVFAPYPEGLPADLSAICEDLSKRKLLAGYEIKERFYEIGSLLGIEDFKEYIERNRDVL